MKIFWEVRLAFLSSSCEMELASRVQALDETVSFHSYAPGNSSSRDVCLFKFYDVSTFVGYLMPNLFLYKWTVLFQTIQFSITTQFNCKNISISSNSVKSVLVQTIQFSISIVFVHTQLNVKTVLFQTTRFSLSTEFKCQNSSISNNSV